MNAFLIIPLVLSVWITAGLFGEHHGDAILSLIVTVSLIIAYMFYNLKDRK